MSVLALTTSDELDSLRNVWNTLSDGVPFRSWDWLMGWSRVYQTAGEPWVLVVYDESKQPIGIAPWCVTQDARTGRVIRQLGEGEVCSDHLSILAKPADRQQVASELADFLADQLSPETGTSRWDAIELSAVDESDPAIWKLVELLDERHQLSARRTDAQNTWTVELPPTWEKYVAKQSKSHRKQLRRFERRVLETDRAVLHRVTNANELDAAWDILGDLHQRRRISLGEPGCFASEAFSRFHRQVAERFLGEDRLRLCWLELDEKPIAVEYQFAGVAAQGDQTIYAYQSGVDPDRLEEEPGRLIMIATIQAAIAEGRTAMDFLRGDEPYKAHWRAEPKKAYDVRIVATHTSARVRDGVLLALGEAKSWAKGSLEILRGEI